MTPLLFFNINAWSSILMLKNIVAGSAALAIGLGLGAYAFFQSSVANADPTKVGFVYVGPIGDLGWTYRHDVGRLAVEEAFGDDVETTYLEMVSEGPAAIDAITDLAETGHDIIFTTSFGYMGPTNEVAASYPDVVFEHATGFLRESDNVSTYSARFYEARVVEGLIAAKMTETNKIGYIASFPIPEVIRGINAFMLEAQKHNPDVEVDIRWVFTWFDPAKEAAAAQDLIDNGADIIVQHTDSPAPVQMAEANGVYAFGQASNMARFGPNAHLVSIVDDWDTYYVDRVADVMDGTWSSEDTWWGFTKDGKGGEVGMVALESYNEAAMGAELVAEAMALEAALASGERHSFPCEGLLKQDGSVPEDCANGAEHLADYPALVTMDWYIQGINSEIPN